MAPSDELNKLLKDLFRDSYLIQEIADRFQQLSLNLQEISVNAAIAAGHCGDQNKVFTEIAKQINAISIGVSETISRIQVHTTFTTGHMLKVIVLTSQRYHFKKGLEKIKNQRNCQKIIQILEKTDAEIFDLFAEVEDRLLFVKPEEEKINTLMKRIWSIVMNLRIVANSEEGGGDQFYLSIADSLGLVTEEMGKQEKLMNEVIMTFKKNLETGCVEVKGPQYAA